MSYTMRDWLNDQVRPVGLSPYAAKMLVESMMEDRKAIIGHEDMDALVAHAEKTVDLNDDAVWNDDELAPLARAIENWHRGKRDWTP